MARNTERKIAICLLFSLTLSWGIVSAFCQADALSSQPPINYKTAQADDPIARLQKKINSGEATLNYDNQHGYLAGVLKALNIPVSSQSLVFSKTSFQRELISPWHPRALYFNNDVYIGWVEGGEVVEGIAIDKQLGPVFYTLRQHQTAKPVFHRQNDSCLQCHEGSMTGDIPGLIIRSVFTDGTGMPLLDFSNYLTTPSSPFEQRWGGWYISGSHGSMRHLGNLILHKSDSPNSPDMEQGANLTDLSTLFDTSAFLAPGSDIVAVLILTHQAQIHNLITNANYETRVALAEDKAATEPAADSTNAKAEAVADFTQRRIEKACEPLVRAMLSCGETPLPDKITGSSAFMRDFAAVGPRDKAGRSLRDLDLNTRVFKYQCSYLIYSEPFAALPAEAKSYIFQRLWDVLSGKDTSKEFAHLDSADRNAIIEIVQETMSGLPDYWAAR